MNAQTTITAPAPFHVGQGFCDHYGRAYIVKIEPVDTRGGLVSRSVLLFGGPSPMAAINWDITIVRESGSMSSMDEHTIARHMESGPIFDHADPAALLADAIRKREETRTDNARRAEIAAEKSAIARAQMAEFMPAGAAAAIVAEYHEDDSDSMSDYYNHKTARVVVIGWSSHTRDLFPELRKAAATFDETAELATAPDKAEHREKYSMGAGYYLKSGGRNSTGWCVRKRSVKYLDNPGLEFSDAAKGIKAAPTVEAATPTPTGGNGPDSGRWTISQHVHTKKGFNMWICGMSERVERDEYDRLLMNAKALGGWYARAWAGTPAGFAFKSEEKALAFTGGPAPAPIDPTPTNGAAAPAKRAAAAPISAAGMGDKLRTMADALQPVIDDKFRERESNTPKRARQAAEARNDGIEIERGQKIMRALAACHDAGTVPACLVKIRTKASILELAKEEFNRGGGYYDAGIGLGRPYPWGDAEKAEQAAAAWALLSSPMDGERAAAEELRRKLDALRFAKIPGFFPTPAELVARMIDEAWISDGSRVLEPSAGSGAIADAVRDAGHKVECVERHASLCEIIAAKGHSLIRGDFLEISPAGLYDAAIMNPPFENGQDLQHVRHAFGWIKPGARLVAIMGAGVMFRQDRKYSEFRDWAEDLGGEFVEIPAGAFKESGTGVASVMFTVTKPETPSDGER